MVGTSTLLSGFARSAVLASVSAAVLASFFVVGDSGCEGACVRIEPSGYDVSCQKDTDCVTVYSGSICPNYGCLCGGNAAINVSGQASYGAAYSSALSSVPNNAPSCSCPSVGAACVAGICRPCDPSSGECTGSNDGGEDATTGEGGLDSGGDGGDSDSASSPDSGGSSSGSSSGCSGGSSSGAPIGGDAGIVAMQSCAAGGAGMTNCGAASESCCTSLAVTGGAYFRTYTNDGGGPTGEADPATVSGFRLDKYEVTVGRFRQFVRAWSDGWLPPAGSGKHAHLNGGQGLANSACPGSYEMGWVASNDPYIAPTDANLAFPGWQTWTPTPGSQENLPINDVNWYESYAFCIWDGGFLPSEAEWEYAAVGGAAQLEYPWGSAAPGADNQYAIYDCDYPTFTGTCTGAANIAPVGTPTLGAGAWGQLDLTGNLWEATLDFYATYVDPCADCAFLTAALGSTVVHGGLFSSPPSNLPPPVRIMNAASNRSSATGLRCARSP
jgi:formylglycine-generating enzyme required for sulfatase activity